MKLGHTCVVADKRELTDLGKAILNAMIAAGMRRQGQLADAAGVSQSTISRLLFFEQRSPNVETLRALATALGLPRDALLNVALGEPPPEGTEAPLHALAAEVGRLLAPDSPLPKREQELLAEMVDRMLVSFRANRRTAYLSEPFDPH